jgi:hypothetical protein
VTNDAETESMTAERAEAYGRIMRVLSTSVGCTRGDEVARIRHACDALALARSPSPAERHAMTDAIIALADLAERGEVSSQQASALVRDIARCAPAAPAGAEVTTK